MELKLLTVGIQLKSIISVDFRCRFNDFVNIQGVPEKLCPVCLKIVRKQQKIITNLFDDVALQMFN